MDWKKYDDKEFLKKFHECQNEIISKWETAEKEIVRLNEVNKSIRKENADVKNGSKLLSEQLDETKKKLYSVEKDLELTNKSITALDEDECAMMEVYMKKEDEVLKERCVRVENLCKKATACAGHFRNEMNEIVDYIPDYIRCCELIPKK